MRRLIASRLLAISILSAACGKSGNDATTGGNAAPPAAPGVPAATPAVTPAPAPPAKAVQHVDIQLTSVGNTMAFDKTKLTVPTGSEVHLALKNNATMATLPHNWVLVKPGTEASVAAAGLKMGDAAGYIDVRDRDVLVHTPLAKPGETAAVTFTAPEVGEYPYICSFPGHYMMMKGVLTVTP